ncbi:MAG: PEP-CTERM sorting domain-containing protein [Planctomycetota bacterium]
MTNQNQPASRTGFAFLLVLIGSMLFPLSPVCAQGLFFNTEISAFDFNGTANLPLGENGASITTDITITRATDHNSSRSNKTSSTPVQPQDPDDADDVNPFQLNGQSFELSSTFDLKWEIHFTDVDPNVDFAQALGNSPVAFMEAPAIMELSPFSMSTFDASAPDFGLLSLGAGEYRHRGHVTVLKANFGGGGGFIDLSANGMDLVLDGGTSNVQFFGNPGNRIVDHTVFGSLSMNGVYNGQPFNVSGLTGTLQERGQLFNNVVPEPGSGFVLASVLCGMFARRRRG